MDVRTKINNLIVALDDLQNADEVGDNIIEDISNSLLDIKDDLYAPITLDDISDDSLIAFEKFLRAMFDEDGGAVDINVMVGGLVKEYGWLSDPIKHLVFLGAQRYIDEIYKLDTRVGQILENDELEDEEKREFLFAAIGGSDEISEDEVYGYVDSIIESFNAQKNKKEE